LRFVKSFYLIYVVHAACSSHLILVDFFYLMTLMKIQFLIFLFFLKSKQCSAAWHLGVTVSPNFLAMRV
jgi:hypothetical protein